MGELPLVSEVPLYHRRSLEVGSDGVPGLSPREGCWRGRPASERSKVMRLKDSTDARL